MIQVTTLVLFLFLFFIGLVIGRLRSLFAAVMLSGIFSLLCASLYVIMDAVDVAFTEAAVGAGVSTVLMLITLNLTTDRESDPIQPKIFPLIVALITGGALLYATMDMPILGIQIHPFMPDNMLQRIITFMSHILTLTFQMW